MKLKIHYRPFNSGGKGEIGALVEERRGRRVLPITEEAAMSDPRREAVRRALGEIRRAHGIVPVSPDPDGWTCPECGARVCALDVARIDGTLTSKEWRRFGSWQSPWSRDPIDHVYDHRHPEVYHVDHPRHNSRGTVRAVHPEVETLGLDEVVSLRKEWQRLARRYEEERRRRSLLP